MGENEKKRDQLLNDQKSIFRNMIVRVVVMAFIAIIYACLWPFYNDNPANKILYFFTLSLEIAMTLMMVIRLAAIRRSIHILEKDPKQTETPALTIPSDSAYYKQMLSVTGNMEMTKSVSKIPLLMIFPLSALMILLYWQKNLPPAQKTVKTENTVSESNSTPTNEYTSIVHRFAADSEKGYTEWSGYQSAREWMDGRTIPAQVLYEDDNYKLEIKDYAFDEKENLVINTVFTNSSDKTVNAGADGKTLFANDIIYSVYSFKSCTFAKNVSERSSQSGQIIIDKNLPYWFDPYLEKYELRMAVWDENGSLYKPEDRLLETDPIIIRTVPADKSGQQDEPFEIKMDSDMTVLYENEDVRVIRTGIYEKLQYTNGIMDEIQRNGTRWEFLVENRSAHDVLIDHKSCTVNGQKALSSRVDEEWIETKEYEEDLLDEDYYAEINRLPKVINAGRRRTFSFTLNREKSAAASESMSAAESIQEQWPLEELRTGTAQFTLHYTDKNKKAQEVIITDEFRGRF